MYFNPISCKSHLLCTKTFGSASNARKHEKRGVCRTEVAGSTAQVRAKRLTCPFCGESGFRDVFNTCKHALTIPCWRRVITQSEDERVGLKNPNHEEWTRFRRTLGGKAQAHFKKSKAKAKTFFSVPSGNDYIHLFLMIYF